MKSIGKYSFGIGDRFGHQGEAQLKAISEAGKNGFEITPVWNKSNHEYILTVSNPDDTRVSADNAVRSSGFLKPYFVDADLINLDNVDKFLSSCDYFTIDMSSYIGKRPENEDIDTFISGAMKYSGKQRVPGIKAPVIITRNVIINTAEKYLFAAIKAWEIYRRIEKVKGRGNFITEISMDKVKQPQSTAEFFLILKMLGEENIPVSTIAPGFTGRFNKGIDYSGDPEVFETEFVSRLMIIDYAISEFGLPGDLKLSLHSGSDKFSLYPIIRSVIEKYDKGIHIKTSGTTWLEEITGLAITGGEALDFVKRLYYKSLLNAESLCSPYGDLIDINISGLPGKDIVADWDSEQFASAVRHDPGNKYFNPDIRQLMHVSYQLIAAEKHEFNRLVRMSQKSVSECVFDNLYKRHFCRLFNIEQGSE